MAQSAPILGHSELQAWGARQREAGRAVVFTNGCFDLLHPGHLQNLSEAACLGDRLLVAVNCDSTVRALKGPGRPLLPAAERAAVLAALRVVAAVTIFAEPTPLETILLVKPAVLVKGAEYAAAEIVGATEVCSWGGRVYRAPMRRGWSTSRIIADIKRLP
jgi:D-beta-D-heptose 7-phosphate kinase/D-beta-D-heptose 1-phosphate adenosyltransferase